MTKGERHCFLKRCHSEDAAMQEADRLRRKGEGFVRAYRCDECGEWHVGHPSQR